jgi:hypothetical protein
LNEEAELGLSGQEGAVTDGDVAEAERRLEEYRSAKTTKLGKGADAVPSRKPEDVLAPSKFPVGLWPYDVYVLDEDVLARQLHNQYDGFQALERWDERLYDDRLSSPKTQKKTVP